MMKLPFLKVFSSRSRWQRSWISFALLCLIVYGCATSSKIRQGLDYQDRGEYVQAYHHFQKLAKDHPHDREITVYANTARRLAFRQCVGLAERALAGDDLTGFVEYMKQANDVQPSQRIGNVIEVVESGRREGKSDVRIRAELRKAMGLAAKEGTLFVECSLGVYDLSGKLLRRAYSRAETERELKEMSGGIVDSLLEGWRPVDKPRVAVLSFVEDNEAARKKQLGNVIAPFIEEALVHSGEVDVISRREVKLIIDEIGFQALDLVKESDDLKVERHKVENVDYLLIGHVSILND